MAEKEAIERAQTFANKALELDSNSSEALSTLALINIQKKDYFFKPLDKILSKT